MKNARVYLIVAALSALGVLAVRHAGMATAVESLGKAGRTLLTPAELRPLLDVVGTPLAGEEVLPPPVRSMLVLLRSNRVASYRYSQSIADSELVRSRLTESSLPSRYDPTARHLLLVAGDPMPPGSEIVASGEGVLLVYHP